MALFLIRHGETALNAARIVQPPDTPLSARGLEQAGRLAFRLQPLGVAEILASDLARAQMTAETLQRVTGAPLALDPGLQERNYGDIRGTPYAELETDIFAPDYDPPGGESWEVFHARVDDVWERIRGRLERVPGNLAVVTHGLVCRALVDRRLRLLPEAAAVQHWANTSLTVADASRPWTVRLLNCVAHLDGGTLGDPRAPSGL